ncbi:hypothetical protein D9M72_486520 [compost metagenome]
MRSPRPRPALHRPNQRPPNAAAPVVGVHIHFIEIGVLAVTASQRKAGEFPIALGHPQARFALRGGQHRLGRADQAQQRRQVRVRDERRGGQFDIGQARQLVGRCQADVRSSSHGWLRAQAAGNRLTRWATAAGTSSASVTARTTAALPTPTASTSRILAALTPPIPTSDGITGCISFT